MVKQKKNSTSIRFCFLVILFLLLLVTPAWTNGLAASPESETAALNAGLGILGDSNTDEYRADDNRGGSYSATTLNWLEQLVIKRGVRVGPWGTWGEPRRTGYKYNWARSAVTAATMISSGQHLGLAQQVAAGEVQYVIIHVGGNDFHIWNGTYREIYSGSLNGTRLQAKINSIVANITTAVDTLQQAGEVKIVLANYNDPGRAYEFQRAFPDPAKRQRVTNAILAVNQGLSELAVSRHLVLADWYNYGNTFLSRIDTNGNLVVGGELINATVRGNEPHHLQLDDDIGHVGTVGSGLIANFFIEALAKGYKVNISPFSDEEILVTAGIRTASPTPVPTNIPPPILPILFPLIPVH